MRTFSFNPKESCLLHQFLVIVHFIVLLMKALLQVTKLSHILCYYMYVYASSSATRAATDVARNNLVEFGRYVQEMMPKYIQLTQITYRYVGVSLSVGH